MSTGQTEREGERPNQSRFVRQSPTDKSRTNSSRSEGSRRARVIRLFTYFRVVIGRLPPLTLSPILSLSRAVKRPRCAPRPLHYRRGTFSPLGAAAVVFSFVSSRSSLRRSFVHPHISTSITAWSMVMFMFRKVTPFGGGGGGGRLS